MDDKSQSPAAAALARFAKRWETRVAGILVMLFVVIAIYAPMLSGEVALVWWDDHGLAFPVISDLFNKWSYTKPHDLLFNIAVIMLPLVVVTGWLLRKRWSLGRRIAVSVTIIVSLWLGCWIPFMPTDHGWKAVWSKRPPSSQTISAWHELDAEKHAPFAVFPLIPTRYDSTAAGGVLRPPGTLNGDNGSRHWLGTDAFGRDVLAQMIFGARVSLTVGLFATGLSLLIGTILGAMSGYFGGWVDLVIQRAVEVMMTFPTFILILVVVAMTGRDIFIIMSVIGLTGWAGTARLVRGEFLGQMVRDYVTAAESLGLPRYRIMFRHILPNALTPLIISATFGIAGAIGSESGLSFVGLGDSSVASWGVLMEQGRENIRYGWLIWAPGLAIFSLIISLNVLGNGVREALDPKGTR